MTRRPPFGPPDVPNDAEVVADTELEPLAEVAPGPARLVVADDTLHLEVEAPLEPGRAYPLPAGFDPEAFPVVDVSIEPFDGDPTHSGNSVLRGVLPLQS